MSRAMESNKGVKPLQEGTTVREYATVLMRFLRYLDWQVTNPLDLRVEIGPKATGLIEEYVAKQGRDEDGVLHVENESALERSITAVMRGVFGRYHRISGSDFVIPVMNFLALSMVGEDGGYRSAERLGRLIAILQYCVRIAFGRGFLEDCRAAEAAAYFEARVRGGGADDHDDVDGVEEMKRADEFKYLGKNVQTPFNVMRQLFHLVATVARTDQLPDATGWMDKERETLRVGKSRSVTVSGIRAAIGKVDVLLEAEYHEVVRGAAIPDKVCSQYEDDPLNTELGHNYLVESAGYHERFEHHLLYEWMNRGDVHKLFQPNWEEVVMREGYDVVDGELFHLGNVMVWLGKADLLLEKMYWLYHVAAGQPSRGTEEVTTTIVNTAVAPRSVYWRGDHFSVCTRYHKSQNITGLSKPRTVHLPGKHSKIWHMYLGFIRPMMV